MTTSSAELFEGNLHLADMVARKIMRFGKRGMEYEDLHQEILIGLDKAARTFDANHVSKVTFERFAINIMHQKAMRFMTYKHNLLHTSKHILDIAVTINRRKLIDKTPQEVAKELNIKERHAVLALEHLKQKFPVSFDQPVSTTEDSATDLVLIDAFVDKTNICEIGTLNFKMFMDSLGPQKKKVIELRMMEFSQSQIAKAIGTSQMEVSRILKRIKGQYIEYMQIS